MCHFRTFSTPPVSEFSNDRLEFSTPLKILPLSSLPKQKSGFATEFFPNGRKRLLRIIFRITAFCATSVQKWFFPSHSGTAPTKITR
jgi:hypothetical protein